MEFNDPHAPALMPRVVSPKAVAILLGRDQSKETVADRDLGKTIVIRLDATLVIAHSDKELAAATHKRTCQMMGSSPVDRLVRQHRGEPGGRAAHRLGRVEHCGRSPRGPHRGDRPDPRVLPAGPADHLRWCRGDQGPPGAHHDAERRLGPAGALLGRVRPRRTRPHRHQRRTALVVAERHRRHPWPPRPTGVPGGPPPAPTPGSRTTSATPSRPGSSTSRPTARSIRPGAIGRRRRGRPARLAASAVLPGPWNRRPLGTTAPARTTPRERR